MKKFIASTAVSFAMLTSLGSTTALAAKSNIERNLSDTAITTAVKAKMSADSLLNPFDITVTTHHGKVYLKGKVDSDTQYEQAVTLAQSLEGVKGVETDDFDVNSSEEPLKDLTITAEIKGKLIQEKIFSDKQIAYFGFNVETNDGTVYLKGLVPNARTKDNVIKLAESIKGVKAVKSDLKLQHG